jgi:hypothetical protein
MRHSLGRRCCFALLLGSACTAPPESDAVRLAPEPPAIAFAAVRPSAHVEPDPRLRSVGPNPGCPSLQVFTNAEDLCAHGIMPSHPFGRCRRLPQTDDGTDPETHADVVQIAAMGGSAELFVQHHHGSNDSTYETVFLALRGVNGYVLLSMVAEYSSHVERAPKIEGFVGDGTSVEVEATHCSVVAYGGIRCNDACPELAIANPVPALDCAALSSFDWSKLPRFADVLEEKHWGGRYDQDQACSAREWLGIAGADCWEQPHSLREVGVLTILEPNPGYWMLLHEQVPLVASQREIRVGRAPGGLFVSSWTADAGVRIQRLNLATHELEPVLPGPCDR